MKFGVAVALLSLFLVTISANEEGTDSEESDHNDVEICNALIQKVMGKLLVGILKDPMLMPKIELNPKLKALFLEIEAILKMEGHIKGLSSLHQILNCTIKKGKDGKKSLEIVIGAGPLEVYYNGIMGAMGINLKLKMDIKIPGIKITITLLQKCKVIDIKIEKTGKLEINFDDLGPLSMFLNTITNLLETHVFELLKGILKNGLTVSIEKGCCEDHGSSEKWCKNDEFAVPNRIY